MSDEISVEKMVHWMRAIVTPEQVVEVRCLRVGDGTRGGSTWSGHFRGTEVELMCEAASKLSGHCGGVYFTLNPIRPDKFVSKQPRLGPCSPSDTATDADILERRWVLVDIDPKRAKGFEKESATDAEKQCAFEAAKEIRNWMDEFGYPKPIFGDSGNGFHLLYRMQSIDFTLPLGENDDLRQLLHAIADHYDSSTVDIDRKVYNPARICKFPGTIAMKGNGEHNRPHRMSRILEWDQ
jgi:hypothetical protein